MKPEDGWLIVYVLGIGTFARIVYILESTHRMVKEIWEDLWEDDEDEDEK